MRALAFVALVACSQPAAKPVAPEQGMAERGAQQPTAPPAAAPVDAREPDEQERLAAIQKAMNELDEAAQGCWAAAATERFDIEGELTVRVDITASAAKAVVVGDTAKNTKLAGCLAQVLSAYRWAPPLHGQTIQLPFKFKAPDGQSVIDRRLVESKEQGGVAVSVLLDENNTGNAAASMLEVRIAATKSTELRLAERAELWYFLTEGDFQGIEWETMNTPNTARLGHAGVGSIVYVPKGSLRAISATKRELRAVVVMVPGGREGAARAGALPTPTAKRGKGFPKMLDGKKYGPATIFLEPSVVKGTPLAASVLELAAGAKVAEHVHANETEMLYVLEGSGTMTIAGTEVAITPTSVIQIPKNTKHAFAATTAVRALQIYTPPGPEQRFKKPPK